MYNYHENIDDKFVATYSTHSVKQQYKNLCAIGNGTDDDLTRIQRREKVVYCNNMSADNDLQYHDIHRKYTYNKHRLAIKLIRACGWDSLQGPPQWVHINTLGDGIINDKEQYITLLRATYEEFEIKRVPFPKNGTDIARLLIATTSNVITTLYGASIVSDKADPQMKMLQLSKLFSYNSKVLTLPVVRIENNNDNINIDEYDDTAVTHPR
jgi:hypothetical protein